MVFGFNCLRRGKEERREREREREE